jgi:hypothetical protein
MNAQPSWGDLTGGKGRDWDKKALPRWSFAEGRPVNTEAAREVASVTADGVVAAQTPRQGTVGS